MVKVTGRTRDPGHLAAHLSYITRNGDLEAEDREGLEVVGRGEVLELAQDWATMQLADSRRRANSPFSVGMILSMPAGTDAIAMRDAARSFAAETFADRFDYVFVLHTDTGHPHVHLSIRAMADDGGRLSPKKADLEAWRQGFARALRDRGVEAEATPRRARGVTRRAERSAVRKLRERWHAGHGHMPRVRASAYRDAAEAAFGPQVEARAWEASVARRQARIRAFYAAQAALLARSSDPRDQALGHRVSQFLAELPAPDSQRLALARELRERNAVARGRPAPHLPKSIDRDR